MLKKIIKTFKINKQKIVIEIGEIARQSSSSVIVSIKNTIILAIVVYKVKLQRRNFFFPLIVDYIEKSYSIGKIPSGFLKREGRPTEKEIITSRFIDRSIRPLFPIKSLNEVQVIIYVLSVDSKIDPDIPSAIGASIAISISGILFNDIFGTVRIGYIKKQYILNPNIIQLRLSKLNLIISGTKKSILMIECESKQLSEKRILNAIIYGYKKLNIIIDIIIKFKKLIKKRHLNYRPFLKDIFFTSKIEKIFTKKINKIYKFNKILEKEKKINQIKNNIFFKFFKKRNKKNIEKINNILLFIIKKKLRFQVLKKNKRIDGRNVKTIRNINIKTNLFLKTHGSALFTRGKTQALVIVTLGTSRDEQKIELLTGEYFSKFIVHYNMPPFANCEIGKLNLFKRREIGHSTLLKKALLNSYIFEKLDYSIRLVSEITESNGSSSMASVCSGSLALMNAGVPIKYHVAGIAMGLIKDNNKFVVLSDISANEDFLGDMDFKIAGTTNGITILQMDVKKTNITEKILKIVLNQSKKGKLKIIKKMQKIFPINKVKFFKNISYHLFSIKTYFKNIKYIIKKKIIKYLFKKKIYVNISNIGIFNIISYNKILNQKIKKILDFNINFTKIGNFYKGTILKLLNFGIIIKIIYNINGLLHISQISNKKINILNNYFKNGQLIRIKILEYDKIGRLRFSIKKNI